MSTTPPLPPIQVNVKGLTIEEAEKAIKDRFVEYIENSPSRVILHVLANVQINLMKLRTTEQNPPESNKADSSKGKEKTTVLARGSIEPDEVVDVMAKAGDRVASFGDDPRGATDPTYKGKTIDVGSPVEVGTILARMDDARFKSALEERQSAYNRALAELERVKSENKTDGPTPMAIITAEEKVQQAKSALIDTQANLDRMVIKSPIKGVVIARRVNIGEQLPMNPNVRYVFRLAKDLKKMRIYPVVIEDYIGEIHEGMTASFTVDAFPQEVFQGKVVQIRPISPQDHAATVVLDCDNSDLKLQPYMKATVKFEIGNGQNPPESKNELPGSAQKADDQNSSPALAVRPAAEMQTLQGRWKVVSIEKEKGGELPLFTSSFVVFRPPSIMGLVGVNQLKYVVEIHDFKKGEITSFIYRINPKAKPKTIDLYKSFDPGPNGKEELTSLGIYEINGDSLRICLANYRPSTFTDPRPEDFRIESGSENVIITLQREQPSADERAIQGKWHIVSEIRNGKTVSDEINTFSFSDYFFARHAPGTINRPRSRFILDPDRNPKTFNSYAVAYAEVHLLGRWLGIYKFESDRLWIAYRENGLAPDKFESTPGSGVTLLELQRSEPKQAEQAEATPAGKNPAGEKPEMQKPQGQEENNK